MYGFSWLPYLLLKTWSIKDVGKSAVIVCVSLLVGGMAGGEIWWFAEGINLFGTNDKLDLILIGSYAPPYYYWPY
jgi:hypothetical protein